MANRSRSPMTADLYNIIGVTTTSSIKEICKAYKSLVKWSPDKNHDKSTEPYDKGMFDQEEPLTISEPTAINFDHRNYIDDTFILRQNPELLRNPSLLLKTLTPKSLSRNNSQKSSSDQENDFSDHSSRGRSTHHTRRRMSETHIHSSTPSLSKNHIVFSQSTAKKKPPPVERKLDCTLEELLLGCEKKIKITRDVIAETGIIVQEEKILWVDVKPGWRHGTKITLEEKGDQKPGYLPADIILSIDELRHPLYEREGDDLEIVVEIPLVNALTGCSIPIPLLGGDKMTLTFDDIIYPGYEKVIRGQGMPKDKEHTRRGDLKIRFLVEFPEDLSDKQRAEAARILQGCS